MTNENTTGTDLFALATLFALGPMAGKGPARVVRREAFGGWVLVATTSTCCTAQVEVYLTDEDGIEMYQGTLGEMLLAEHGTPSHVQTTGRWLLDGWTWPARERARERADRAWMAQRCALGAA